MADILSKTGIIDNSTVRTWHVTQSIDAFTKVKAYDITLSGSFEIIGPSNLTLPITGANITSASFSISSSTSLNGLTASNTTYADISRDTFFLQLHHGSFKNPVSQSFYYFSVTPLRGAGADSLTTSSAFVGTNYPTSFRIVSASLSYTINGIAATGSIDPQYTLYIGPTPYLLSAAPNYSTYTFSTVESINADYDGTRKIYMEWKTGDWTTAPQDIAHNLVLYCDRGYNPV
jgi:hypothetical protein